MPSLHVLLKKEDVDPRLLEGRVVIVLDILFATSTMVNALAAGAAAIWPALDGAEANVVAASIGDCLRSGEHLAELLPGFAPAWPLLLAREPLHGRELVYCTTNGTVALRAASRAAFTYVGSLLNAAALVEHIRREHPDRSILIVCSGSVGQFNMEDFYGAGHLVDHFQRRGSYELNDAARAARFLRVGSDSRTVLMDSRVGLMMRAKGLTNEVEYCAQLDILNVVGRLRDGSLRRVD